MRFTTRFARTGVATTTLLALVDVAAGHSWIERATKIVNGALDDSTIGYPRGPLRGITDGWADTKVVWQFPGQDNICAFGKGDNVKDVLSVNTGDQIALRYLENGHVTMPNVPVGHPNRSGVIFIYMTCQGKDDDKFADIHRVWNAAGTGGDGRGRLIATRFYDDGQCYEFNDSDISKQRQAGFPVEAGFMGQHNWCQNDIVIPNDMSGECSVYWVWDWPILADTNQLPFNYEGDGVSRAQTYSSCMDLKVGGGGASKRDVAQGEDTVVVPRATTWNAAIVQEQQGVPYLADFGDLTKLAEAAPEVPAPDPAPAPAPAPTPAPAPVPSHSTAPPAVHKPVSTLPADDLAGNNGDRAAGTVTVTASPVTVTAPALPAVTVTVTAGGGGGGKRPTITISSTTMQTVTLKPSTSSGQVPQETPTSSPALAPALTPTPATTQFSPVNPDAVPVPTRFMRRALPRRVGWSEKVVRKV